MKTFVAIVLVVATLSLAGYMLLYPTPKARSPVHIAALAEQLYEFGAIRYVHKDSNALDFDKVAMGEVLSPAQSCDYRQSYTEILANNAVIFRRLDDEIHFHADFGMHLVNNCDGFGIEGTHDLHDHSAKKNLLEIASKLEGFDQKSYWNQIRDANKIAKDLTDIMVHYAPAVHALGVDHPEFENVEVHDALREPYLQMLGGFKQAQFADVNSCHYWEGVETAMQNYVEIVVHVESQLEEKLTDTQRKIAGRWLSLQTVAPRLNIDDPVRQRPVDCPSANQKFATFREPAL